MKPDRAVVDASVLIALVTARETAHRMVRRWFESCSTSSVGIVSPAVMPAEFCGVLGRTGRSAAGTRRVLAGILARPDFTVAPLLLDTAEEAAEIALLQHIKGCDAIYLALARSLTAPLVTVDREQLERLPADVEVLTPEQALAKWWPS